MNIASSSGTGGERQTLTRDTYQVTAGLAILILLNVWIIALLTRVLEALERSNPKIPRRPAEQIKPARNERMG